MKPMRINTTWNKVPQYLKRILELIDLFEMFHPTVGKAGDGWVQGFAKIEGGDATTADQIVDIVKGGAIKLASHYPGPIIDLIPKR